MILHYVKVVREVRPKFLLLENVQGIAARHEAEEESFAAKLLKKLDELGYDCVSQVLRAADCGVAQERPRYIVLGVDRTIIRRAGKERTNLLATYWAEAIEEGKKALFKKIGMSPRMVSCKEAIGDLQTSGKDLVPCKDAARRDEIRYVRPINTYQRYLHGQAEDMDSMRLARHSPETVARFQWIQENCSPGVNVANLDLGRYQTKKHAQAVLNAGRPSRTLTTLPDDLIHYAEPRILTVREYARLQSFPDWFKFQGKYTTGGVRRTAECPRYTQVGNAVAPFVGEVLGYAVRRLQLRLESQTLTLTRRANVPRKKLKRLVRGTSSAIRVWRKSAA